ncbi:hypothetical protein PMIN04_008900 [Paraphaeosphaeria minitans]
MLSKLASLLALATLAIAAPQGPIIDSIDTHSSLVPRDARNCTFTAHFTQHCLPQPPTTTPKKITYVQLSHLLTPSLSAVPVPPAPQPISPSPFRIMLTSRNELIAGELAIDRVPRAPQRRRR